MGNRYRVRTGRVRRCLLVAGSVVLFVMAGGQWTRGWAIQDSMALAALTLTSPSPFSASSQAPDLLQEGRVETGQSAYTILRQHGVSAGEVLKLQEAVRAVYDIRHVRVGQPYSMQVTPEGVLQRFMYEIDAQQQLEVERHEEGYVGRLVSIPYLYRRRVVSGTIRETLYETLVSKEESPRVAADLADIFAWEIDFHRDLRQGDTFRLLIEERYREEEDTPQYYRIIMADLATRQGVSQAVYYAPKSEEGAYYRPDGQAMRRRFLRSPLKYTRVSSRFTSRRFHPILGRYMPHWGIDYAAPTGTPVHSVADGVAVWAQRKGANGNLVEIRHDRVYSTYYLHLSRFAESLRAGTRVRQGDVIGYVGATGLATGPHLCFRLTENGTYLNPAQLLNVAAPPLSAAALPAYRAYVQRLLVEVKRLQDEERQQVARQP